MPAKTHSTSQIVNGKPTQVWVFTCLRCKLYSMRYRSQVARDLAASEHKSH